MTLRCVDVQGMSIEAGMLRDEEWAELVHARARPHHRLGAAGTPVRGRISGSVPRGRLPARRHNRDVYRGAELGADREVLVNVRLLERLERLAYVALRTPPMPERLLKLPLA